jgi:hypothetical protein
LINQLCYGNVAEDTLLREIKNQETDVKIDAFENDQVRFVTEALQDLTKRAFGTNIFFTAYLTSQRISKEKSMESKRYYKLLDSIKNELPERLFKNITFIDSEQYAKVLKKIPVFELYQNYLEGQYVSFNGKYYLIDKIDYDNGIVELTYSSNNTSVRYRQCRQVSNVMHRGISKELPVLEVRDSILKKSILRADIEVNTDGYYEFNNEISFASGSFAYKKVDAKKKGLRRNYKSTNVLAVNIASSTIAAMSQKEKFRLSFTLSVLLNEMFETLFSNIKQYIIVRSVVADDSEWADFADEEITKLYRPIVDTEVAEGINIYITEDTELEKGITDTIVNNFDNVIMRLLFDYFFWLLKEKEGSQAEKLGSRTEKWLASNSGDYINVEKMDKFLFLKYGGEKVNPCLNLEGAFECLYELILKGNDTLTYSRFDFIRKRVADDPFKILEEKVNHAKETAAQKEETAEPPKDKTSKADVKAKTEAPKEKVKAETPKMEQKPKAKAEPAPSEPKAEQKVEEPKVEKKRVKLFGVLSKTPAPESVAAEPASQETSKEEHTPEELATKEDKTEIPAPAESATEEVTSLEPAVESPTENVSPSPEESLVNENGSKQESQVSENPESGNTKRKNKKGKKRKE